MKASLHISTYNKNEFLPNTLYSIARQKISFPFEVCIVDDCSDIDPEPVIRKFLPNAKYKRLNKYQPLDISAKIALDFVSDDTDILIMQSDDVIHCYENTIEKLCNGVDEKTVCMAIVHNANPPFDMYKNFEDHLSATILQWKTGTPRSIPGRHYFFLGSIRKEDFESLQCTKEPWCDNILKREMVAKDFKFNYDYNIIGFHQYHEPKIYPCTRISTCDIEPCVSQKRKKFKDNI